MMLFKLIPLTELHRPTFLAYCEKKSVWFIKPKNWKLKHGKLIKLNAIILAEKVVWQVLWN